MFQGKNLLFQSRGAGPLRTVVCMHALRGSYMLLKARPWKAGLLFSLKKRRPIVPLTVRGCRVHCYKSTECNLEAGGHKEMSSILADQERPRIRGEEGGCCGASANEYMEPK